MTLEERVEALEKEISSLKMQLKECISALNCMASSLSADVAAIRQVGSKSS